MHTDLSIHDNGKYELSDYPEPIESVIMELAVGVDW